MATPAKLATPFVDGKITGMSGGSSTESKAPAKKAPKMSGGKRR